MGRDVSSPGTRARAFPHAGGGLSHQQTPHGHPHLSTLQPLELLKAPCDGGMGQEVLWVLITLS